MIKLVFFLFLVFTSIVGCTSSDGGKDLSPLMNAVRQGDVTEIQRLLDQGHNINETTEHGTTPVTFAVLLDQSEVVGFLMDNGADVSIPNKMGRTALTFAAMGRKPDILKAILDRTFVSKESMSDLMLLALWVGDLESTEIFLAHGASATTVGEKSGKTPLAFVSENKFLEAIELFERYRHRNK